MLIYGMLIYGMLIYGMLISLKLASRLLKRQKHIEQNFVIVCNKDNVSTPQPKFTLFNIRRATKLCTFCVVTLMYISVL